MSALLALSLAMPARAAPRELREVDPAMTPRELCDNLRQLDLRRLKPTATPPDRSDTHARMQAGLPAPDEAAPVMIRALVGGGMGARGPAGLESVIAWRDGSGRWHAQRAEEGDGRAMDPELPLAPLWPDPSPRPMMEGRIPTPGGMRLTSGPISPGESALLDKALLADSCIDLEPPSFPTELPLRRGGKTYCVPDSAWRHLEIRQAGTVRRFIRPCQSIGPVGLIGRTLDGLALPGAPVVRNRSDLYNGTSDATAPSLRAFLTERLPGVRYRDSTGEGVITVISHVAPCETRLELAVADGSKRSVAVRWKEPRSYPLWIEDGVVALGRDGGDPSWIAPGTTLALQLQGALFHLYHSCDLQP